MRTDGAQENGRGCPPGNPGRQQWSPSDVSARFATSPRVRPAPDQPPTGVIDVSESDPSEATDPSAVTPAIPAIVPVGAGTPPAPGRPVRLARPGPHPRGLYLVSYADEDYVFGEGSWGRFGRDDSRCQIPVWEEVRGSSLSRVAGELWCLQGDLWLRNLSTSHELSVVGSVGRPTTLPPRHPDERGAACSVPSVSALVSAPSTGEWVIHSRRLQEAETWMPEPADEDGEPTTARMAVIPEALWPVATELCAPMLEHGAPPATYDEIAARLAVSKRQARRYVDKLCEYYGDSLPEQRDAPPHGQPHYVPVAELLVGRGRITRHDVERQRLLRSEPDPSTDEASSL